MMIDVVILKLTDVQIEQTVNAHFEELSMKCILGEVKYLQSTPRFVKGINLNITEFY